MRKLIAVFLLLVAATSVSSASSKVVVFWQDGFPTVSSQPITRAALLKSLDGMNPIFVGIDGLRDPAMLANADLLVLPYGSATPVDAWSSIYGYLRAGGNLLILGGQPFRVPVTVVNGKLNQGPAQDTYAREFNFRHTYELPPNEGTRFAWRFGYSFMPTPAVRARRFFAVEGALLGPGQMVHLDGLGYMTNADGLQVAAPVIVADHTSLKNSEMAGARIVMLDFEPEAGYWESTDGLALVRQSANYAAQGATEFWIETLFSTLKPREPSQLVLHLRNARQERLALPSLGEIKIELLSDSTVLDAKTLTCSGSRTDADVSFAKPLPPGFYTVRAVYAEGGQPREFYQNGFWVEDEKLLTSGPNLGVKGDFLNRDGKPYFPVGTNYFTTEDQSWDFSGPRNAWIWERDFAEMARYGVTFVRTGVWAHYMRFVEPSTGAVNERFLRNLEAYLLCARRHNIIVNFTFFAFAPRFSAGDFEQPSQPASNPYIDPVAIRAEQSYILSVVNRFENIPWLSWDLINEPSFSNPQRLWKGNTPNGDPAELAAWRKWLREKYGSLGALSSAWSSTPETLQSFDGIPLPSIADLTFDRYGNARHVRAVDYNLFAQDMFTAWVRTMITAIRSTGSRQPVNVGQDEGGITDRVLNHFYAEGGVSFTTNHSYWRDDDLLWDSVVAKRLGMPNILGETGYQPVWAPDGAWRYDEITGQSLLERKWALGFAAGNSGILQWDWAREVDYGMKRTDGSAKMWQTMMRDMGQFAEKAAPWATDLVLPQVAIVLPQSLQLSIYNPLALEAQQKSVRALYHYARAEAYAVGEYQTELLGDPRLIILPSPTTLTATAWTAILDKVRAGATLLVSGPFDKDAHFHDTNRHQEIGIDYREGLLSLREDTLRWPEGQARLSYGGEKTTYLHRAILADGRQWAEKAVGKGRILFAALPLELNDNLQAIGDVYRYALKAAGVVPTYSTKLEEPGILICPTRFPHATLYVLASETGVSDLSFRDHSGKQFSGTLEPGRAALLLIKDDGSLLASYNWKGK